MAKLGDLLARRLDGRRKSLLALPGQMREAQKTKPAAAAALAAAIDARRKALSILSRPFTSTFVTLDEPFLIWELPNPNLDI